MTLLFSYLNISDFFSNLKSSETKHGEMIVIEIDDDIFVEYTYVLHWVMKLIFLISLTCKYPNNTIHIIWIEYPQWWSVMLSDS